MFQQSARAAIEATVLYADVRRIVVNPSPYVACLPRWSSEPALRAASSPVDRTPTADEVDTAASPRVEPDVRRKLQQVFSLDVGILERSQQHHHQQQQQQQLNGSGGTITTTQL